MRSNTVRNLKNNMLVVLSGVSDRATVALPRLVGMMQHAVLSLTGLVIEPPPNDSVIHVRTPGTMVDNMVRLGDTGACTFVCVRDNNDGHYKAADPGHSVIVRAPIRDLVLEFSPSDDWTAQTRWTAFLVVHENI
ncbi:hypothetical protein [Infectious spleen and kidney necrosis virus]|uniref:Uncharacterized protein n=1 Tax=Infectious spleen and kidney necrosis virus TaxID=180170 RepID=A0A7T1KQZ7_ISKNV|nr:hypothetical protein [Infectious spleen and kidney necrosis virus]QPO16429.1 hypothetical protein [Infectious spleen and kidney necrosis virus]